MKAQDLKYWHLVSLVKIRLVLFVFTIVINFGNAQEFPKQSSYYKIINDIMFEDREVKSYHKKSLQYKMRSGKITTQDSIKYVNSIRNKKLNLVESQNNSGMKGILKKHFHEKNGLYIYLGSDKLADLIKETPKENKIHSKKYLLNTDINLVEKNSRTSRNGKHTFSAPIKIKRKTYMVYHTKRVGILAGYNEIIIYRVCNKSKYSIEKRITTSGIL